MMIFALLFVMMCKFITNLMSAQNKTAKISSKTS
jgi:hypothetical protein